MANELARTIMNNIAEKNIGRTNKTNTYNPQRNADDKDNYELQKSISLSNYSSGVNSNYKVNSSLDYKSNTRNKKAVDLNSLARETRGEKEESKTLKSRKTSNSKAGKSNTMTLDQLSKMSGGSDQEASNYKPLEGKVNYNFSGDNSFGVKTNKNNLSLDSLARNIKKNI